ncbi:MAG: nicotinate (nicotinamide) nucleotide adenylyltransferase [Elusimicrobia bacterium]|nr:nicotinate (nicotinamide) nucleotide adenylyltransferase [Elusimicrobiota bacterium]
MRILLFGGSFDPPHRGHIALLKAAIAALKPDRTRVLPAFHSPLKAPSRGLPGQRLALLRLALSEGLAAAERKGLGIDAFEIKRKRKSYTCEAVRRARRLHPGAEIHFLVGSDALETFHLWKKPEELRAACRFVVGLRPGYPALKRTTLPKMAVLPGLFPDISSTEIRKRLLCGESVGASLQPAVLRRIQSLGLYGAGIRRTLSRELKPGRLRHTLGVARAAAALAARHGLDVEKAALAGLLHDCARTLSLKRMARLVRRRKLRVPCLEDILRRRPGLLHSYLSEDAAQRRFGVFDREVLSAVRKHTLGALRMSALDRLLYTADACSGDRRFPEAARIRRIAQRSLEDGFREAVRTKLLYLLKDGNWIHPLGPALWNGMLG